MIAVGDWVNVYESMLDRERANQGQIEFAFASGSVSKIDEDEAMVVIACDTLVRREPGTLLIKVDRRRGLVTAPLTLIVVQR